MRSLALFLLLLSIVVSLSAAAASPSTTAPTYLRVASSLPIVDRIVIGSKNFDNTGDNKVTPYQRVDPGQFNVDVGNKKLRVIIPAGSYSTLVLTRDGSSTVGFVVKDDSSPPPNGMMSVKFVHADPRSPIVSVEMRMAQAQSASLKLFTVRPQESSPAVALQPGNSATFEVVASGSDSAPISGEELDSRDLEETNPASDSEIIARVRLSNGLQNTRYTVFLWPGSETTTAVDGSKTDTDPESGASELKSTLNAALLCALFVFMLLL